MRKIFAVLLTGLFVIFLGAANLKGQMGDEQKSTVADKPANGQIDPKTADIWRGDNPTDEQIAKMSQEELKERVSMKQIEDIRKMKFKKMIKSKAVNKEQFAKAYGAKNTDNLPMGFYSYNDETLYVNMGSDAKKLEAIRMHESVHALQHQHWGYEQAKTSEQANILRGIREGEATAVPWVKFKRMKEMMFNFHAAWQSHRDNEEQYTDGSAAAGEYNAFDYAVAAKFVDQLMQKDGWDAVSKLFKEKPPLSTSQMMHPEKYMDKDKYKAPVKLDFPNFPTEMGEDWKLTKQFGPDMSYDTFGEFNMRLFYLGSPATGPEADKIPLGWDGDWYTTFGNDKEGCEVWLTAWESNKEAVKWVDAQTKFFEKTVLPTYTKKEDSKLAKADLPKDIKPILEKAGQGKSDVRYYTYEDGLVYFESCGNFAIFVEASHPETLAKILGIVQKTLDAKK